MYKLKVNNKRGRDMTVSKTLIAITFLLVATLLVGGVYFASSPLMWFAATGNEYHVIRGVILALLVALFLSRPPRSLFFRALLGMSAALVLSIPLVGVLTYQVGLVDAVVFIEVGIILGIEALEYQEKKTGGLYKNKKWAAAA